jgi:hypothetical protein
MISMPWSAAELKERAEKGYAWLLESGPQHGLHVERLDTDTLDVSSSCTCVLGQLGGKNDFNRTMLQLAQVMGMEVMAEDGSSNTDALNWATEHGFYLPLPGKARYLLDDLVVRREGYEQLTEAWCEVIAERALQEGD